MRSSSIRIAASIFACGGCDGAAPPPALPPVDPGPAGCESTAPPLVPVQIAGDTPGDEYSFVYAVMSDGTIRVAAGIDGAGAFTKGVPPQPIGEVACARRVAATSGNGAAIRQDGTVAVWGDDYNETLGDGLGRQTPEGEASTPEVPPAVDVGIGLTGYAVTEAGELYWWGKLWLGPDAGYLIEPWPIRKELPEEVRQVSVRSYHACALGASGAVYCWGQNDHGQLGTGDTNSSFEARQALLPRAAVEVAASAGATCGVLDSREVYCWGANTWDPDSDIDAFPFPTKVEGLPLVDHVRVGPGGGYAWPTGGQLWRWGLWYAPDGGSPIYSPPSKVDLFPAVLDVAVMFTQQHCVLRADHKLVCTPASLAYCGDPEFTDTGWDTVMFDKCCTDFKELCLLEP